MVDFNNYFESKYGSQKAVPAESKGDPTGGDPWLRKIYAMHAGLNLRWDVNLPELGKRFLYEQFPHLMRDQGLNPELDAQGDPWSGGGMKDTSLPSTEAFDQYRKDWLKWTGLTTEERSQVWTASRKEKLVSTARRLGLGEDIVDSKGAIIDPTFTEGLIQFGLAMTSAEVVIPFGQSVKGAMVMGGVLGAMDSYIYQKANNPEVSPGEVAIVAAGGAALGGLLPWGGAKLWNKVVRKLADKKPVDPAVLGRDMERAYIESVQAKQSMEPFSLDPNKASKQKGTILDDLSTGRADEKARNPGTAKLLWESIQKTQRGVAKTTTAIGETASAVDPMDAIKQQQVIGDMSGKVQAVADMINQEATSTSARVGTKNIREFAERQDLVEDSNWIDWPKYSKKYQDPTKGASETVGDINVFQFPKVRITPYKQLEKKVTNMEALDAKLDAQKFQAKKEKNAIFNRTADDAVRDLYVRDKDLARGFSKIQRDIDVGKIKVKQLDEAMAKRTAREIAANERRVTKQTGLKPDDEVVTYDEMLSIHDDKLFTGRKIPQEEVVTMIEKAKETADVHKVAKHLGRRVQGLKRHRMSGGSEGGQISSQFLYNALLPAVGGLTGFALGEEDRKFETALAGIVAGYAPIGLMKFANRLTTEMPPHWDKLKQLHLAVQSKNFMIRPYSWLPQTGHAGDILSYGTRAVLNQVRRNGARTRGGIVQLANTLNLDLADKNTASHIVDVASHRIVNGKQVKPANKAVANMVSKFHRVHDSIIDRLNKAGVIDDEALTAIRASRKLFGFWPVTLDEALVSTKKAEWVDYFSQGRFDPAALKASIKAIASVKDTSAKSLGKHIKLDAGGGAYLEPDIALALWQRRKTNPFAILHSGKEDTSGIREVLEPWSSKDIIHVVDSYYNYAERRIAFAEAFGPKHEGAYNLFDKISKESSLEFSDAAAQAYWGAVHDSRSLNVKRATMMNPAFATTQGRLQALNTPLLALAQIFNMTQGYTYSAVKSTNLGMGMWDALKTTHNAALKMMNEAERTRILTDTGSAGEIVLLQLFGEMSNAQHSIMGRDLTGTPLSALEWLQNPSKFLKTIKFIGVEEFNRALASAVGEANALRLVQRKVEIGQQIPTVNIKEANKLVRELKRIDEWMKELGMDTKKIYSSVDQLRADELRTAGELAEASMKLFGAKELRAGGELAEAAINFSDAVNYTNNAMTLPLKWTSPYAALLKQFNTFAFHHAGFMYREVIKPIVRTKNAYNVYKQKGGKAGIKEFVEDNNFGQQLRPLAMFLTVGGVAGGMAASVRWGAEQALKLPLAIISGEVEPDLEEVYEWMMEDDDEMTLLSGAMKAYGSVGGLGRWVGILNETAQYGFMAGAKSLLGPTISRGLDLGVDLVGEMQKEAKTMRLDDEFPYVHGGEGEMLKPLYTELIEGSMGSASRALLPDYEEIQKGLGWVEDKVMP